MTSSDDEIEISFEVLTSDDGLSFTLQIDSTEKITYAEFLDAVRSFLEAEEGAPGQTH